ncbi:MAG TPA: ATP-binding protein, partial [Herpetosiphonaceae bacterium]|nr:ATP-binding protein [Herpetosiphonaceae bacterium]
MLDELLESGESTGLACFRERFRPDELAETLVAFANGSGGSILIGVAGRVRPRIEGVSDVVAAEEAALEAALACTPPLVLPLPRTVQHQSGTVLILEVP